MPRGRPRLLPGEEVTPFQRAFVNYYLTKADRDPVVSYEEACKATRKSPVLPEKLKAKATALLETATVQKYLAKRQEELAAAAQLTEERVLLDLMELRDMCMGRKPMPMASFDKGELVTGLATKLDPPGAAKALELIGKYLSMWTDKVKHSADANAPPALFVLNLGGPTGAVPPALDPAP